VKAEMAKTMKTGEEIKLSERDNKSQLLNEDHA
jgi:hypothetical protein